MAEFTNKNLDFLSNEHLAERIRLTLTEIDAAATARNHRSTVYLAMSAIEGICSELVRLKGFKGEQFRKEWDTIGPKEKKVFVEYNELKLATLIKILSKKQVLPDTLLPYYRTLKDWRNQIHPAKEVADSAGSSAIPQSIAQLGLAALNAIIEKFELIRFAASEEWRLLSGQATVPESTLIYLPAASHSIPLLVSEEPATTFQSLVCQVHIPQDGILNFVYSYVSQDHFMAARIEGRSANGRGFDNGKLVCHKWGDWRIDDTYTVTSEPNPNKREHDLKILMNPPETFAVFVDGIQLELEGNAGWDFDPKGKIGFLAEQKNITISNLVSVPASASGAVAP